MFAFFFLFSVVACSLFFWFVFSAVGMIALPRGAAGLALPIGIIVLMILFAGLMVSGRALRGAAMPLGDLIEAAGSVAEGDYSQRVSERGPRELRALARAFNAMTARLEASEAERRDLLADVTHDLRTPLTVIQGNLEGLLDGVYPTDRAHIERILDETRVLARLIDDLRTLALAERGALVLQKETIDFAFLLNETVSSFQAQAQNAGVELSGDAVGDQQIEIDPARIRQVLDNLISNALRYTPHGGTIRVKSSIAGARLVAEIVDSGNGIAPEDLPHIFDRFYKSRDSRGTGLGLAIARKLVEAHGGAIFAQSELGRGTTIRFELPLSRDES